MDTVFVHEVFGHGYSFTNPGGRSSVEEGFIDSARVKTPGNPAGTPADEAAGTHSGKRIPAATPSAPPDVLREAR